MVTDSEEDGCFGEWDTCRICGAAVAENTELREPGVG
jgi:hypothetical protein